MGLKLRRAKNRSIIEWLQEDGTTAGLRPLHHFSFAFLMKHQALLRRIESDGAETFRITLSGKRLLKNAD